MSLLRTKDVYKNSKLAKPEESFDPLLGLSCSLFTICSSIRNGQPCASWESDKVDQSEASEWTLRLSASICKFTRAVVDHEAGWVDCCENGFSVDQYLDSGLFGAEEAKSDLIKARSYGQNHAFVFVP